MMNRYMPKILLPRDPYFVVSQVHLYTYEPHMFGGCLGQSAGDEGFREHLFAPESCAEMFWWEVSLCDNMVIIFTQYVAVTTYLQDGAP